MTAGKVFIATPYAHRVVLTALFGDGYTMQRHARLFQFVARDMSTRNSRIGLALFAVYLVFYGGFVLMAAFAPQTMESLPFAEVNLAVWYGFGLIVVAILAALIYGLVCRNEATADDDSATTDRGGR